MVPLHLSDEQRLALGADPSLPAVPVFDPVGNQVYYLVPAAMYERLRQQEPDDDLTAVYPLLNDVASAEGWDDPEMDAYNQLDPRRAS
jgi:hypothetical protein